MAQSPYPFSTMVQKTTGKVWRPNMGVAQWARVLATRSEDPRGEAENQLPRLPQSQHMWPGTGTPHNKPSNCKISKQSQTWSFCFLNTSWIRNQSCLNVVGQLGEAVFPHCVLGSDPLEATFELWSGCVHCFFFFFETPIMPLASFPHYWAGTHPKPFHNTLSVSTEPLYCEAAHTFSLWLKLCHSSIWFINEPICCK